MTTEKAKIWSGFWARVFALIIDAIILGVVCFAIGWFGIDYVSPLGSNGRAIGLLIGTLYFGLTASSLGGGRTLGMRASGLKIIGQNGKPLGLLAAMGRALLLVGPWMLNGWNFTVADPQLAQVAGIVAITAVFGVTLAQIYLLLFNLPTRRLLHDLIFGAAVVKADAKDIVFPKSRVHGVVAGLLVAAGLGLAVAGPSMIQTWMPNVSAATNPQLKVMAAVNALPEVSDSGVSDSTTTFYPSSGPQTTTRTLIVTARVRKWPSDPKVVMAKIGATTVKAYEFAPGQRLTVKIVYGFDLGLANYVYSQGGPYSPQCTTEDVKCLDL